MKTDKELIQLLLEEMEEYKDDNFYHLVNIISSLSFKGIYSNTQEVLMSIILRKNIIRDNFTGLDFSWEEHSKEEIVNYLLNLLKNYEYFIRKQRCSNVVK